MKVLKFTLDQELPEIVYLEETLGMGDSLSYEYIGYEEFIESLGLGDVYAPITEESVTEDLGLDDDHTIILPEDITEVLGLGDVLYQYDRAEIIEALGLNDAIDNSMTLFVELNENIGLSDGGYGYKVIDYHLSWRTRTKKLNYGYGAAPYGASVGYGDGDVVDELKEFKVKVIRISDSSLLRTETITIANKLVPDASARYTYTASNNVSDNGYFEPTLRFEVYQVDVNDVWSPAKYLDITTDELKGNFE